MIEPDAVVRGIVSGISGSRIFEPNRPQIREYQTRSHPTFTDTLLQLGHLLLTLVSNAERNGYGIHVQQQNSSQKEFVRTSSPPYQILLELPG